MPLSLGSRLGPYKILAPIGAGGMGEVESVCRRQSPRAKSRSTQQGFAAEKPRQLFESGYLKAAAPYARANYDVSPDGQRFLMLKPVEQGQAALTQINVVLNWTEELKRPVPKGKM